MSFVCRRFTPLLATLAILAVAATGATPPAAASHGTLTVSRSPSGPVAAGSSITVTAVVENTSALQQLLDANLGASFTDPLLTFIPGTVTTRYRERDTPVGTIVRGDDPGDDGLLVDLDPVPPGWHAEVRFRLRVAALLPAGEEEAFGQVSLSYPEGGGAQSIPAFLQVPIVAEPDLELTKNDFDHRFVPGGAVTYNLFVQNRGSQGATGLVLTDTIPDHTTLDPTRSSDGWSCSPHNGSGSLCTLTFDRLRAGDFEAFSLTLVLRDHAVPAGLESIRNVGQVRDDGTNTVGSDTPIRDLAVETTPVDAAPDLVLAKSDGGATVGPGATVTYDLSFRNDGSQDATGVRVEETVPDHATFDASTSSSGWTCTPSSGAAGATCALSVGALAAGASGSAAFAVRIDDALPAGIDATTNSARVHDDGAGGPDPTPADNTATDTTPLRAVPDLSVSKMDGDAVARAGDDLVYRLSYRNGGDQGASGVVLTETVPQHTTFAADASDGAWSCAAGAPAGSTCTLAVGALGVGVGATADFAVRVDSQVPPGVDQLVNTVDIEDDGTNGDDPTPGNNSATEPSPVVAVPDLALTKTDGGATVRPGETVTYTLTYRNVGDQGATGVLLEETLPDHVRFAPGASAPDWSCTSAVPVSRTGDDLKAERIQGGLEAERIQADLKAERIQGDLKAERIQGRDGPQVQTSATVCTLELGELPAGASDSIAFAVTLADTVPADLELLHNTASVRDDGANGDDPNPGDNTATDTTPVQAAAELALTKTDAGATLSPGDTVAYSLTVRNDGDRDATGVRLRDVVPDHTHFDPAASDDAWTCAAPAGISDDLKAERIQGDLKAERIQGGLKAERIQHTGSLQAQAGPGAVCTLELGDLPAGASDSAVFAVTLDAAVPAALDLLTNSADARDDDGHRASATDTTPVDAAAKLTLTKTDGGATLSPGDTVAYSLTVRNDGDRDATGVRLRDVVPDHTHFDPAASDDAWTCTAPAGISDDLKAERIQGDLKAEHIQGGLKAERIQGDLKAERIQHTGSLQAQAGPGAVCTLELGDLSAGASDSAVFAVTLDAAVPAALDTLTNSAHAGDAGGHEASATDTTPIDAAVNLVLAKTDGGVTAEPGATVSYTLEARNHGTRHAAEATFEETVPDHTRFDPAASDDGWTCTAATLAPAGPARIGDRLKAERIQGDLKAERIQRTGSLREAAGPGSVCTLTAGPLPVGASAAATFAVTVDDPVPEGLDRLVNHASVRDAGDTGPDADPADNEVTVTTPLDAGSDDGGGGGDDSPLLDAFLVDSLAEDRDASGSVTAGDVLSYSVRIENVGSAQADAVVFEIPSLEHIAPVSGSVRGPDAREVSAGSAALRVELGALAAGESTGFAWDAEIADELPEALRHVQAQGSVAARDLAPHPSDDPDTPAPDDPTRTPLAGDGPGGPGEPVEIPTLSEWGLLFLTLLLAALGWRLLR